MPCQKKSKEIQIILLKESSFQQGIYMTTRFNFPTRVDESHSDKKMFFRQFTWQSRHLHYKASLGREKFFWFTYLTDTSLDKPSLLTTYRVFADESPNVQGSKLGQHQNCSFFQPHDQNTCALKLFKKDNIHNVSPRMIFSPKSEGNESSLNRLDSFFFFFKIPLLWHCHNSSCTVLHSVLDAKTSKCLLVVLRPQLSYLPCLFSWSYSKRRIVCSNMFSGTF